MSYYYAFRPDPSSFADRVGEPSEFASALGLLVLNFQDLEETISLAIATSLRSDRKTAAILTAGLSFKQLVGILGALARRSESAAGQPRSGEDHEQLDELLGLCLLIEGERNRFIHSWWSGRGNRGLLLRRKRTARMDGLKEQFQHVAPTDLLDIADYCGYLANMVEDFFDFEPGKADVPLG